MRLIVTVCFLLLCVLNNLSFAQHDTDLAQIKELMNTQDYSRALTQLKLLKIDTLNNSNMLAMQAKCQYHLGQWHESKILYKVIIKHQPDHEESLNYLARIYEQESNWPKAIKYYLALLKTDTTNSQYLKRIGLLHIKINENQLATDYLSRAMQKRADDVVVLKELATLWMNIDSISMADSLIQLALSSNPNHVSLNLVAAQIQYKIKAFDKTVDYLEFASKKIDLNEYYVKMLGYSYLRIDSVDKAIHQLENIQHSKEGEHIHYYLALAYEQKENLDQAIFHYDQAIHKSISNRIDVYCSNASAVKYEQKDVSEAIDYLKLAHRYTNKNKYLLELAKMSDLYYKDKNIAIRYYNRFIKSGSSDTKNKTYAEQRMKYLKELNHQQK